MIFKGKLFYENFKEYDIELNKIFIERYEIKKNDLEEHFLLLVDHAMEIESLCKMVFLFEFFSIKKHDIKLIIGVINC